MKIIKFFVPLFIVLFPLTAYADWVGQGMTDVVPASGDLLICQDVSNGNTIQTFQISDIQDGTGTDDQTAAEVAFTPNGSIAAVTVQLAIQEVRDEAGGSANIETDVYGAGWNGDDTNGASQNVIYDYLHVFDADDDGDFTDESWFPSTSGAPTDVDYLVGTADAGLSNEIVVPAYILTILDDTNEATVKATMNLEAGTDYNAFSAYLADIAGLTPAANNLIGWNAGATDLENKSTLSLQFGASLEFEGATPDDYETTATVVDPTADRTLTIGNYDSEVPNAASVDASGNVDAATGDSATAFFDAGTIEEARIHADIARDSELPTAASLAVELEALLDLPDLQGSLGSSQIATIVESIAWNAAGTSSDGTQCADPAEVTINSGPVMYTTICADNDGSTIYGHVLMPDSWDGGTVTMESEYLQTAADTDALNGDIAMMCRGTGETINNTWGTEIAIDDAAVSGSNIVDHTTSAAITANGTCAGGDTLFFRYQMDTTGTTTAVATLHFLGWKMEYTSNVGD